MKMSDKKSEKQIDKIKEEVFGAVKKIKAAKNYVISPEIIRQPLVENGTVVRVCCLGCGYCLEVLESGAKLLAKLADVEIPISWDGYYFETEECLVCSKKYKNITLKRCD